MIESVTRKQVTSGAALAFALYSLACEENSGDPALVHLPSSSASVADTQGTRRDAVAEADEVPPDEVPPWGNRLSPQGGFPCDVDLVLALSCRRCHFDPPENDAPFPLAKYEGIDVIRSGKPIRQLMEQMVAADLMPPLDEPVEPKVTPLTPGQKKTLLGWLKAGAPKNANPCP